MTVLNCHLSHKLEFIQIIKNFNIFKESIMKAMKKFFLSALLIAGVAGLSGCQLGVLSLDIGIGFESGAYVISE